jgi:RHS repeat-associated protein
VVRAKTANDKKDDMDTTLKVVEYTYDVFDRRIGKEVDTTSPFTMTDAVIERYIIDDASGIASIAGGNVILDFVDADGDGAGTMDLERRYLYGNAVDQVLAQENIDETTSSADRVHWHLTDNLGTVRDLAKNDGTAGEHYEYDAYGNVVAGNTSLTRYLFTSREFDEDIDLQYNRARWYDPAVGRWISEDPIGFAAGDTNVARYVSNSATTGVDPSGLKFGLFGQDWYMPWEDGAGGFGVTVKSYAAATGQAVTGTASGAATGAVTGAGTGVVVGAIVGAPAGGVGAAPGAAAGATAGAYGGAIWGGITGLISAATADTAKEALVDGAKSGGIGGAFGGAGKAYQAVKVLNAAKAAKAAAAVEATAAAASTTPLIQNLSHIADDALVHFGPTGQSVVKPAGGKIYAFKFGDIKHLTPKQIETLIGSAAQGGRPGGAKVLHVLDEALGTATKVPSTAGFSEYTLENATKVLEKIIL